MIGTQGLENTFDFAGVPLVVMLCCPCVVLAISPQTHKQPHNSPTQPPPPLSLCRTIFAFLKEKMPGAFSVSWLKLPPNSSPPSIAEHNAEKGRTEGRWAEARRAIE
jgi:hypothetical protein